jgi:hypothetical protein
MPKDGRPSIPPERLLRALLLQTLYTIRRERRLMVQLDDNLLFRWFVGRNPDDALWVPSVFAKDRDRLFDRNLPVHGLREFGCTCTRGRACHRCTRDSRSSLAVSSSRRSSSRRRSQRPALVQRRNPEATVDQGP